MLLQPAFGAMPIDQAANNSSRWLFVVFIILYAQFIRAYIESCQQQQQAGNNQVWIVKVHSNNSVKVRYLNYFYVKTILKLNGYSDLKLFSILSNCLM